MNWRFGGSDCGVLALDDTSWRPVAALLPGSPAALYKVAGSGPTDIWAVGDAYGATDATLMLHWDGTRWTQVPAPHPGSSDYIRALAVRSASDAWFAGELGQPGPICTPHPFIGHWNGTTWTEASSPAGKTLYGVATDSASDGWIVGNSRSPATSFASVLEHWNRTAWSMSSSP